MNNAFKALASRFQNVKIYSHDILEIGSRFVLKINNQFAGVFKSYGAAADVVRGLAHRGNDDWNLETSKNGRLSNIVYQRRATDLIRRLHSCIYFSNPGNPTNFQGWSFNTIRPFLSTPHPTEGGASAWKGVRAFGANVNPSQGATFTSQFNWSVPSPSTTSPWHNILYENIIEDYEFGFRAFTFHMPFGSYSPGMSWMCTPIQWEDSFTSTVDPTTCAARWKGFWEGCKQLLNGTFPAPAGGRTQITDPLDICVYVNGAATYRTYRDAMHSVWTGAGGAAGGAGDTAVLSLINRLADRLISLKPADNLGILTVCIDAASPSATPTDVHLFRSLPDYKSDVCELADWRLRTRLIEAGIPTLIEARTQKIRDQAKVIDDVGADVFGTAGAPAYTGFGPCVGDGQWMFFTHEDYNPAVTRQIQNLDMAWHHVIQGSLLTNEERLPYGVRTKVFNGAAIRDLIANPSSTGNIYTPFYALQHLYHIADMCQDWLWRTGNGTKPWLDRLKYRGFFTYGIWVPALMGHDQMNPSTDATYNGVGGSACRYTWYPGNLNYMPDTWNLASFQSNPTAYTGSYWTPTTKAFFNTNIRNGGANLQDWVDNVMSVLCYAGRPPNTPGTETVWGTDAFYNGSVSSEMRTP